MLRSGGIVVVLLVLDLLGARGFVVHSKPGLHPFGQLKDKSGRLNRLPPDGFAGSDDRSRSTTALHKAKVANGAHGGLLVGNMGSTLSKFFIGPKQAKKIYQAVSKSAHAGEIALIAFFGVALPPICRFIYSRRQPDGDMTNFKKSYMYKVPHIVSQMAQIAGVVYACDLLSVALGAIGLTFPQQIGLSIILAQLLYSLWGAYRLMIVKRYFLCKAFKVKDPKNLGRVGLYDRLLDAALLLGTAMLVLDILSVQTGRALSSIFALGSIGTLVFSLAANDLASQVVNGIALVTSAKFRVGDKILLGDNTIGTVEKLSWMETQLRGSDEFVTKIPNKQLAGQRVSNISRVRMSQVKQTIYISYQDINKLASVIEDIKEEIKNRCPMLVTDGSRPFRVHWREYKEDHLEIVLDSHFNISPYTNAYYENRQQVLFAIADAAKKNQVQFDLPTLTVKPEMEGEFFGVVDNKWQAQ